MPAATHICQHPILALRTFHYSKLVDQLQVKNVKLVMYTLRFELLVLRVLAYAFWQFHDSYPMSREKKK